MKLRGWFWLSIGGAGCLFLAVQLRAVWLPWVAQNLIFEDTLDPADVIVVFAGARGERARYAADLYRRGLAPRILVTGGNISKEIEMFCSQRITGAELEARVLTRNGVPSSALIILTQGSSTYEEGKAIQAYTQAHDYDSIIAVSSPYHMRRIRATLRHLFRGTAVRIQYSAEKSSGFEAESWWQREKDMILVTTEYLKLIYYHLTKF